MKIDYFSFLMGGFALLYNLIDPSILPAQTKLAKDDYVIFLNGDTIHGKISTVKDKKVILNDTSYYPDEVYRVFRTKKKKMYAPSYLEKSREVVPQSKPEMYRIKNTDRKDPTFAELVEDGEIIVYYFSDVSWGFGVGVGVSSGGAMPMAMIGPTKTRYWYAIKKDTREIMSLRASNDDPFFPGNKKRAIILKRFMSDAPELCTAIDKERKLNYPVFLKYIKEYNRLHKEKNNSAVNDRMTIY